MMLLTTRLRMDPNGQAHIPGSIEIWKNLFINHPHGKYDAKLTHAAPGWKDSDDVLEALFGLSRKSVENEPLKIFMALSDLDRNRAQPLKAATVDRLARSFKEYGAQYAIFNDAPTSERSHHHRLSGYSREASIRSATPRCVRMQPEPCRRSSACGRSSAARAWWRKAEKTRHLPVSCSTSTKCDNEAASVRWRPRRRESAAGGHGPGARGRRNRRSACSGCWPASTILSDTDVRDQLVTEMQRVLEAQRILSLDIILQLADNLEGVSQRSEAQRCSGRETGRARIGNSAPAQLAYRRGEERAGVRLLD